MNNIHDYALSVLKEHDCDIHTYGDHPVSVDELESELREAYPSGMQYPYRDTALAIIDISKPSFISIPQNGFAFGDWGSWGIGDFYPWTMEELVSAIKSGKPFNTGWHGFKKELESMCIIRDYDNTVVQVSSFMDEMIDQCELLYDFLTEDELERITDEMIEEIQNTLVYGGSFTEECEETRMLPVDASFDDIVKCASELLDSCENGLKESFRECIAVTLSVLYGESDETYKLINERCKQVACD